MLNIFHRSRSGFTALLTVAVGVIGICSFGCSTTTKTAQTSAGEQPEAESQTAGATAKIAYREYELGSYARNWSTNDDAQAPMNQGLNWYYAFNSIGAISAFTEASRRDPDAAAPYIGLALANGPNINNTRMSPPQSAAAWDAIQKAQERAGAAAPVERALIDALSKRYDDPAPEDRTSHDRAYAEAMARVYADFPDDPDVATLYAESLMIQQPWKQWSIDGRPQEGTLKTLAVLEDAIDRTPLHPGAHHFYIHAVEASSTPEMGLESAAVMETAVPDASHLVHMPSHIYVRTGRWEDATTSNIAANAVDHRLRDQPGYMDWSPHHIDFMRYVAAMSGNRAEALANADALDAYMAEKSPAAAVGFENLPPEFAAFIDPYLTHKLEVYKRFGMWDEILAAPPWPEMFVVSNANRHCLRAIAFAGKGEVASARRERDAFVAALELVSDDSKWGTSNYAIDVLRVAEPYIDGEIAYREGQLGDAIDRLRIAVAREDGLVYDEPPVWPTPTRHALGAVLLEAGRPADAEAAYRADLKRFPENGWALFGLGEALAAQGKDDEATIVRERFEKAWARSDFPITTSCQCVDRSIVRSD